MSREASCVVFDMGYLRIHKKWREQASRQIKCAVYQVESDVIVPVELASPKEEYSAGTFRPKIMSHIDEFLKPIKTQTINNPLSNQHSFASVDINDIESVLQQMTIDRTVSVSETYRGGMKNAKSHLQTFIKSRLEYYGQFSNDPSKEYESNLSPYLHFGQISPLYIALEVIRNSDNYDDFLEQLIVRRELAINFCYYNEDYDNLDSILNNWALESLTNHAIDNREYINSTEQLEFAKTHDPYWNAAQKQLLTTGKMHGYMRMYWGKKIIEWTENPHIAHETAIYLNDKYELDGRDPNGYAGIAWCFGKHDRAWKERPIFGKVRYMNDKGLERKFNIREYVQKYGY